MQTSNQQVDIIKEYIVGQGRQIRGIKEEDESVCIDDVDRLIDKNDQIFN